MRSKIARILVVCGGALLASCGTTTPATPDDQTTSSIALTLTTTTTIANDVEEPKELATFADGVVATVNSMQNAWDEQLATANRQLFNADGSANLIGQEAYAAEAEHFATVLGILWSAGDQLPTSSPSAFTGTYSAFLDAHDSLTGWFGQLSGDLAANASSYAEDVDAYDSSIGEPLAVALNKYLAACFDLQAEFLEWSDALLECGPQPPEMGPNGFLLFTGEDSKMRSPGHYENSNFFRTITFVSDGNWICNNECTHGHEEFGDAFELKFTEVPGAWLIIAGGGEMTAIEHYQRFEADPEINVGEPNPFEPSENGAWEGLMFTIEPSPEAGFSYICGSSSLPCASTELGRDIELWAVSYAQTVWILTESSGRTIVASAHFSPGYEPPAEHREILLASATPLVASLGFPD